VAKNWLGGYSVVEMTAKPRQLDIFRMAIPMRSFEHAAAGRSLAEAVVLRLEYDDGSAGWGETLPRQYVTGETLETVPADVEKLWATYRDDLARLPGNIEGRCVNAAAAGLELATLAKLLDGGGNLARPLALAAGRGKLAQRISSRVSGVLGSKSPAKTARRLGLMRLYGLSDFKLKLGLGEDIDRENLRIVHKKLRKPIAAGRCSLRVDINGGWDAQATPQRVEELRQYGVCAVEQPVYCSAAQLVELAGKCPLPLIADESLLSEDDARTLLGGARPDASGERKIWWNIRLSKNGGLLRTLRLMNIAAENAVPFTLGCMVGESSILSAVQRRALQLGPTPRFVEGNYGRFLLAGDILASRRSLKFGYGGKLRTLPDGGLGVNIDEKKIGQYARRVATLGA